MGAVQPNQFTAREYARDRRGRRELKNPKRMTSIPPSALSAVSSEAGGKKFLQLSRIPSPGTPGEGKGGGKGGGNSNPKSDRSAAESKIQLPATTIEGQLASNRYSTASV